MTAVAAVAYVDTHTHLDDEQFHQDIEVVMGAARLAGVGRIVNIGYRPGRWETTIALAARFSEIAFTLGLHPHHADLWTADTERDLLRSIEEHQPVAIGEIGLDYYRNLASPENQRAAFVRQLEIAAAAALPVVIHMRTAEDDLYKVLEKAPTGLRCVLHSFDGTARLADLAVERGWYLGVGGLMTRPAATALRDLLAQQPLDRLLLETDSPYLAPAGCTGRRNEPANIPTIAGCLAALKNIGQADVARVTTEAAYAVFGLDGGTGRPSGVVR